MSQAPPPPPPPQQPPPGNYGYGAMPARTSQKAVWSLVLGILGLLCCGFFTGIPAIILGKTAQSDIDASGGAQTGRGMATAGLVIGIIAVVYGVVMVILALTGHSPFHGSFSTSP